MNCDHKFYFRWSHKGRDTVAQCSLCAAIKNRDGSIVEPTSRRGDAPRMGQRVHNVRDPGLIDILYTIWAWFKNEPRCFNDQLPAVKNKDEKEFASRVLK